MSSSLPKISIDSSAAPSKSSKPSKAKVADSWEDEDLSEPEPELTSAHPAATPTVPSAPPPTPISPSMVANPSWPPSASFDSNSSAVTGSDSAKRPEKTDAVARRMIAASLGMKVPKLTEEQKAYQKSVKDQEKKRRELEKAEQQRQVDEANKAKAAVWDN